MKFCVPGGRGTLYRLGAPALALILWLPLLSAAQNPPPDQPSQNPPPAPQKQPPAAPKPSEKKTPEPAPGQIQLETPEAAPTAKPGQQPQQPQKLETPTTPAAPPEEEEHKPTIEDIIIRGNRRIPASTLRARIFSHKGDVYDENALERDFMALWNTGFLDDVRLEVADAPNGNKIITFYVREKKLVRSIDYKGLSTVEQSDVLDAYKKEKVGLSIQSQYDPVVIKRAEVVLQELLAAHGKMFATVRHRTRNIPPNSVALTFIVVEGPKVKLGAIRFSGNTIFSDNQLVRSMKYSRPAGAPPWFYWFHKTYDKERIEADLENIRDLYRDHGYFYALPKEPETKMIDTGRRWPFFFWSWGHGKRVDIKIALEEGVQYRLGTFHIRGCKLFKEDRIAPILGMKPGDIFALSKVRKAIENYTKLYGQFGYINFTADPDIEPDNRKKVINLALDFQEDNQFTVHRIDFSGNTKTRDKVIRRELLLDEGGIFSSQLWDYSVLKMNQLGFFDEIKKEDYDIKQNAKEKTVDVLVKVKEKGKNSIGFNGGISGLAGNFVGLNYATNNFLGLGATLSLAFQWGTFQKMYSFGFTKPYFLDRPITAGFTVFKSDYNYNQIRQLAIYSGVNPNLLAQSQYGQYYGQNFTQNSEGFTMFATYPLHRSFARVGLTYSLSRSSLQAFSAASESYFQAINFSGLTGPNALRGIISSQIMPTYLYSTINSTWTPTKGKYLYAAIGYSGSAIGGNVNTITPVIEAKYFHPVRNVRSDHPTAIGMRLLVSSVVGYGGRVVPPFSRFYIGGEMDVRGFDIRTVSPVAFYPTVVSVCNRNVNGQPILGTTQTGQSTGQCGSSTSFPINSPIFPGGDTEAIYNFEYRFPIVGSTASMAFFSDTGGDFVLYPNQLQLTPSALSSIESQYSYFPIPRELKPIATTNFQPRSSVGLDLQILLPVVNAPIHIFYGYNILRVDEVITPPQDLPPQSLFPNVATYIDALKNFQPFRLKERSGRVGFTVQRTF
ncbi:MAG: outer membrane protein assembly factor BamA [Terriglobia bacterium]